MNETATAPGLRHRKKDRTRANLQAAAIDLFFVQGFDTTTIDEIAAKADVSQRTFFRYFKTKEDVMFSDAHVDLETAQRLLSAGPADQPIIERIRAVVIGLADGFSAEYLGEEFKRHKVIQTTPSLLARQTENSRNNESLLFDALKRPGLDDTFVRLVIAASIAALRVAMETWLANDAKEDLTQMAVKMLDGLSTGLGSEPA